MATYLGFMRLLMLAPHPFFQERGTPIACLWLCRVLGELGHEVELLTFPGGGNVDLAGLRVRRLASIPFIRKLAIGFSPGKLAYDALMLFDLLGGIGRRRVSLIHANEESVFLALMTRPLHGLPVIYDMDSSMADQLLEKWAWLRPWAALLHGFEALALKHADAVMPVCSDLADRVRQVAPRVPIVVVEDLALPDESRPDELVEDLRSHVPLPLPLMLYVGNLESYQGVDLLLEALVRLPADLAYGLCMVGGNAADVAHYREMALRMGLGDRVHFLGPRPIRHLNRLLAQADVLLSPRNKGNNTPMKVYSYLASGKAVVATRIRSHLQSMDDRSACLVDPEPEALAQGITAVLSDEGFRLELGRAGAALAQRRYSPQAFRLKVRALYELSMVRAAAKGRDRCPAC
jgi:glycosyltransferase involved in cell wall biosynthesis